MKINVAKQAALVLAMSSAMVLGACSVEQTEEGNMPEVEVTEKGNLPEYDVETADVSVGTKEATVTVPDVDVTMPDEKADAAQDDANN